MHTALHTDSATKRLPAQLVAREKNAVRCDVMRRAWRLWKLAQNVAKRPAFDHWAIVEAAKANGLRHREAVALADADYADRRTVRGISSFADALRAAWGKVNQIRADRAYAAASKSTPINHSPEADARMIAAIAAAGNE